MTAYTSSQAGDWNDSATWGGGGTPGDGDTASIGHAVTVTASVTVGTEPADTTTYVITVTSGGTLTINTGVTLTVEGNIQLNGAGGGVTTVLTVNGSGKLVFDGSPVSSSRVYVLRCEYRNAITLSGTDDSNRATIEADAGGGYWQLNLQGASQHLETCSYGLIKRCGDASNLANPNLIYVFEASETLSWTDTKFEDCGKVQVKARLDSQSITMTDCEWINSAVTSGDCLTIEHDSGVTATITTINRCIFDKRVQLLRSNGNVQINNSYFGGHLINSSTSTDGLDAASGNNLIIRADTTKPTWHGSCDDNYFFNFQADGNNEPTVTLKSLTASDTIANNVTDWGETSPSNPDGFFITTNASGKKYTASGNFVIPDTAGTASGAWLNIYYSTSGTVDCNHNTVVVNGAGQTGTYIGESGGGAAGQLTSFKSNLFWTPTGDSNGGGFKLYRHTSSTTQDIASATNCDYNWSWNLAAGSEGDGYQCDNTSTAMFSTGTPDGNGGSGDPQFVDATRNLIRFDIDNLGNSAETAWADATAYSVGDLVSASTSGFVGAETVNFRCITAHTSASADSTNGKPGAVTGWRTNWEPASLYRLRQDLTRIATLKTWVEEGFAVQNASLNNAGHDSVTIGAGDYQAAGNPHYYYQQQAAVCT